MSLNPVALIATVLLLLPMGYFLLAAPGFLLVRLDIPQVTLLLRSLFSGYFLILAVDAALGTLAFAMEGRMVAAAGVAAIVVGAVPMRTWFLRQLDEQMRARDAGDPAAVRKLRQLHWQGMVYNGAQLAILVAAIPRLVVTA